MKGLAIGILVGLPLCLSLALIPAQEKKGSRAVPAVDQAAPAKIETATLALG